MFVSSEGMSRRNGLENVLNVSSGVPFRRKYVRR